MGDDFLRGVSKEASSIRRLVRQARKAGWDVSVTRGGHILFRGPKGERYIGSMTAHSGRSLKVVRSYLRKHGVGG